MKKNAWLYFLWCCFIGSYTSAQNIILTVKFDNFSGKKVDLYYINAAQKESVFNIVVENGRFAIPDSLISAPQVATLSFTTANDDLLVPVLLAPGYQISLRADARDMPTFHRTSVWLGRGSVANVFYSKKQNDGDPDDPYFDYFKMIIEYNALFDRLDKLMQNAVTMLDAQSPKEVNDYINAHFDHAILKNISDSNYLSSPSYRAMMGHSFWYLFYLVKYDAKIQPNTLRPKYQVYLDKITEVFTGEVRDYILYRFVNLNLVAAENSYEKFRERAIITMPYLEFISNKDDYNKLLRSITEKENMLSGLKSGDPAPAFTLPDLKGVQYELANFKGKIVLLDFWASWCGPCRQENRYIQELYRKYKTEPRVAFVSIAVRDKKSNWLRAVVQDKPGWLQLFDATGQAAAHYFTNAIPKFVVIDEKGAIVDFQAPAPSDGNQLKNLIERLLEKRK